MRREERRFITTRGTEKLKVSGAIPQRIERRGAPRIASRLPLTLSHDLHEWAVHTKNISTSGAYCTVNRFLVPMTKLNVRLELPTLQTVKLINCQGVVVRVIPPRVEVRRRRYDVAIFFNEMALTDRTAIAHYVEQHQQASSHG